MYERLSDQASRALKGSVTGRGRGGRKASLVDLLRELLKDRDTAAGRLVEALHLDPAAIGSAAEACVAAPGRKSRKALRYDRSVERAVELCRQRGDRSVTTAHLLAAACEVLESLAPDRFPCIAAGISERLPQFAGSEPKAGSRNVGLARRDLAGRWASQHLSSAAHRVLEHATDLACSSNGGLIEPEHLHAALRRLQNDGFVLLDNPA